VKDAVGRVGAKVLSKVAGKLAGTAFGRLMDRRAAKGGKVVLWWRRVFGRVGDDVVGEFTEDVTHKYLDEKLAHRDKK
jgi:hypothetical protein